jgi:hypothetical protein
MLPNETIKTTIGDLANAFYEEALREFGDERVARDVSATLLQDYLSTRQRTR